MSTASALSPDVRLHPAQRHCKYPHSSPRAAWRRCDPTSCEYVASCRNQRQDTTRPATAAGAATAFITVTAGPALREAHAAEAETRQGHWRGALHGIPIALKDLVDTAGVRTTAASGVFKDRIPTADAEIVRRLKAAGAWLLTQCRYLLFKRALRCDGNHSLRKVPRCL